MANLKDNIVSSIPNSITLLNLVAGCFSIVFAMQGQLQMAAICIFIGGVFDFMDGLAARVLKAYSELGKMLDSMADMVTFGIAPAIIMFQLLRTAWLTAHPMSIFDSNSFSTIWVPSIAFLIAVFSGLRLAKFNIDTRQSESFIGVPTPAMAFFVASFPLILLYHPEFKSILINTYTLLATTVILSGLMVAEIPMLSFKFKNLTFSNNRSRFILLAISILLIVIFQIAAYPLIFIFYVLLSIIDNSLSKRQSTN
jgi:CDP-diacylglycerol--serine O-phosphatidyltransferase